LIEIWRWVTAAAIAVGSFAVLMLVRRFWLGFGRRRMQEGHQGFDAALVQVLAATQPLLLAVIALGTGSVSLGLPAGTAHVIAAFVVAAALLQAAVWGSALITFGLGAYVRRELTQDATAATTLSALGLLGKVILWAAILLMVLANLGVNINALVAGLGISSIAVALALQSILGDMFASISIALDKPFVIGDFITVDTFSGSVEYVGLKSTRIRSITGEIIVVANSDLLRSRIRNYRHLRERRVVFAIGVTYETPAEKLAAIPAIVAEIVTAQADVRFDRCHFKDFGPSALDFEIVYFMTTADFRRYMDVQQAINLAIFRCFADEGIEFAYPTQTLYVKGPASPATPGLRPGADSD